MWLILMVALAALVVIVFAAIYYKRIQTVFTIRRETSYDTGYNLYSMDVKYRYCLEDMIAWGMGDNPSFIKAVLKAALPLLPLKIDAPNFGCSAFGIKNTDGEQLMGRNYDFANNTSAMLVYTEPKEGYRSLAFAALDNLSANVADKNFRTKLACLAAPFYALTA